VAWEQTCCQTGQTVGHLASAAAVVVGFLAGVAGTAGVWPGTVGEVAWPAVAAGVSLAGEEAWLVAPAGL